MNPSFFGKYSFDFFLLCNSGTRIAFSAQFYGIAFNPINAAPLDSCFPNALQFLSTMSIHEKITLLENYPGKIVEIRTK